jgi:hypothetical protein
MTIMCVVVFGVLVMMMIAMVIVDGRVMNVTCWLIPRLPRFRFPVPALLFPISPRRLLRWRIGLVKVGGDEKLLMLILLEIPLQFRRHIPRLSI